MHPIHLRFNSTSSSPSVQPPRSSATFAPLRLTLPPPDGDPATNFPTDGYLIGTRLNASRAVLLQSGDTLILRAKADSLPGLKTAEKIKVVEDLLAAYRGKSGDQQETLKEKEIARLDRDELLHVLNTRRASIQHAADAI